MSVISVMSRLAAIRWFDATPKLLNAGVFTRLLANVLVCLLLTKGFLPEAIAKPDANSSVSNTKLAAKQLVAKLQKFSTLKGHFTQTLYSKNGELLQSTQGLFKLKRPGLYLWQSAEPYPQTIVGNGQTLWVYDPDLEQVTITPQDQMPINPAMLLSGGIEDLSSRFVIGQVVSTVKQGETKFNLTPIDTTHAPFALVNLIFVNDQIASAELTDRLGQKTVMGFNQLQVNTPINDAQFTFEPPKGTDVLVNE